MTKIKLKHNIPEVLEMTSRYPEASAKAREVKVQSAIMMLEQKIKEYTPEGAGPIHLRETIHSQVLLYGKKVLGIVGTPAKYAEAVEYGTKPHFPPISAIKFWVEGKLHLSGKEAKNVAWAIATKIADVGTEGAHMFQYAWEDSEVAIIRILEQIPAEIIRQVQNGLR